MTTFIQESMGSRNSSPPHDIVAPSTTTCCDELAAITQIPSSSVNWLLDHGASLLEVGKIAGNSVPWSVASVPVADTSRALARMDCLLDLDVSSGVPVIDVQAPMVVMEAVKTVLIPVHAASLEGWLPDVPGTVWGQVVRGSSPRESAVKQGEQWVKSFLHAHGLQKGATVEHASDRKDGDLRTRVVVWVSDLPPVFHRWYTVARCPDPSTTRDGGCSSGQGGSDGGCLSGCTDHGLC